MDKNNFAFRAWYYFRMGWATYFAFIFAAINTLTVTYYLAIENYPVLNSIFPSFLYYILLVVSIGIPILVLVGYVHYKKTSAYRAESEVIYESNPFARRMVVNTEILLSLNLQIIQMLTKLSNNEKISKEEIKDFIKIQDELEKFVQERTFENNNDLSYLKKIRKN